MIEETVSRWLEPLSDKTRAAYLHSLDLLGQVINNDRDEAARLLVIGEIADARAAVQAVAAGVQAAGHTASTANQHLTALCGLAKLAGRDLGLRQTKGGWRPRQRPPETPDEARLRRLATKPDLDALVANLVEWAPSLRKMADTRGMSVPAALAWALQLAATETRAPGYRLAGRAALELTVMSGDLLHLIREQRRAHRPARERVRPKPTEPAPVLTLSQLEAQRAEEIAELERLAGDLTEGTANHV